MIKTEIKQWVNGRYYKEITIDNSTFKTMSFKKKENVESYGEYLINKLSERVDKTEIMNDKRLKQVYTTLAFLRSVIMSGEPMTNEVRNAIDDAIYNLRDADKDIKN